MVKNVLKDLNKPTPQKRISRFGLKTFKELTFKEKIVRAIEVVLDIILWNIV